MESRINPALSRKATGPGGRCRIGAWRRAPGSCWRNGAAGASCGAMGRGPPEDSALSHHHSRVAGAEGGTLREAHALAEGDGGEVVDPGGGWITRENRRPDRPTQWRSARGITGGGGWDRARQVLPLEAREPGVDLREPQQPLLERVSLHFQFDGWMPIELLQQPSPGRQRCKEFLLAAVGRWKRFPRGRHGCSP